MIFVSESLDQIITSNVSSGTISIIEQVTHGPRKTWGVTNVRAGNGSEGFDVSPDGKEIWAANAEDGTVTIIDVASKKVSQTVPVSVNRANRLKFTPDGKQVLISGLGGSSTPSGGDLAVLDAATRKEVKLLSLGGGSAGILVAPDGMHAYVAVSTNRKIAVVDLKKLEVIGQISMGNQPDGLAWAVRK